MLQQYINVPFSESQWFMGLSQCGMLANTN
jgi:hypothetical protein